MIMFNEELFQEIKKHINRQFYSKYEECNNYFMFDTEQNEF